MRTKAYSSGWLAVLWILGCGQEAAETNPPDEEPAPAQAAPSEEAPSEPEAPAAEPPSTEAPAGPRAEAESYVLEARPEADGYHAGDLGQFALHLSGRSGWHLNQEFPFEVELEGPAEVTFPKATLQKQDAAEFTDDAARVDVPFTAAAAGDHEVRARVSFAVCSPSACVPKTATVALHLSVD